MHYIQFYQRSAVDPLKLVEAAGAALSAGTVYAEWSAKREGKR